MAETRQVYGGSYEPYVHGFVISLAERTRLGILGQIIGRFPIWRIILIRLNAAGLPFAANGNLAGVMAWGDWR